MTAIFPSVDFNTLPDPASLQVVDFEAELEDAIARFLIDAPQFEVDIQLESSPLRKMLQEVAYLRVLAKGNRNAVIEASFLTTASGADLDNLAAIIPLQRREGETDALFRNRVRLSFDGFSTAGPEAGYIFHVLQVVPDLLDVLIDTRTSNPDVPPGEVHIYVLTDDEGNEPYRAGKRLDVALLLDENVIPDTDRVLVFSPDPVGYDVRVELTVSDGPSAQVILDASRHAIQSVLDDSYKIGGAVRRSQITAAAFVPGVIDAVVTVPASDVLAPRLSVPRLGTLDVVQAGDGS